jgi:hypothetical protein
MKFYCTTVVEKKKGERVEEVDVCVTALNYGLR